MTIYYESTSLCVKCGTRVKLIKSKSCVACSKMKLTNKRKNNAAWHMYNSVKGRAKKCGIDFNITMEDICIPVYCPVLGIKLESSIGKGMATDNTPSLDRFDPSLGYIKGNVNVISMKANRIKTNSNVDEVKAVISYIENHISGI